MKNRFLLYAGITLLIIIFSLNSFISFDFATSLVPGWHTTIYHSNFFIGQLFSSFSILMMLLIVVRWVFRLKSTISDPFIIQMNKILLCLGTILLILYLKEFFDAWNSGMKYESYAFANRAFGPFWWAYWSMLVFNVLLPQLFWFKKIRSSVVVTFFILLLSNCGLWFERLVIILTSFHRDYLPSSWILYAPTYIEIVLLMIAVLVTTLMLRYFQRSRRK